MTREEAIKKLVNARYADEFQGDEELTTAHLMAIQALSQEPCDDAISREAVLERAINVPIAKLVTNNKVIYRKVVFVDDIENLPPVTPQQKYGKWIDREEYDADRWKCSECGRTEQYQEKFCPNCGCHMVEPQESEEQTE